MIRVPINICYISEPKIVSSGMTQFWVTSLSRKHKLFKAHPSLVKTCIIIMSAKAKSSVQAAEKATLQLRPFGFKSQCEYERCRISTHFRSWNSVQCNFSNKSELCFSVFCQCIFCAVFCCVILWWMCFWSFSLNEFWGKFVLVTR